MGYDTRDLSKTKQVKWGVDNEEKARDLYIKSKRTIHAGFECRLSGFVIDPEKPYLGASPDGIATCKCCEPRVVEIKCPFKHKDTEILVAARTDPDFCLDHKGELKVNHAYYTQVQVQMHVNRMKVADLCVYTKATGHIVENIKYNEEFMCFLLKKCDAFFYEYLLPEILTRKLDISVEHDDPKLSGDDQLCCVCKQPEYGKMIACDNQTCDIVWFHHSCANVRRKPEGKWFCYRCRDEVDN